MSRPWLRSVVALCLCVCPSAFAASQDDPNQVVRLALQAELEELHSEAPPPFPEPGPALTRYRQQLVAVAGDPSWVPRVQTGTIGLVRPAAPALRLGVNAFRPEGKPRGTLLFVHGYMSHAANFAFAFRKLTQAGWNVVTLDLPGHGLSTGPRADIESFSVYGDAVRTFLDWVGRGDWEGPRVLMAHSLGSAAALEALRRPGTPRPDRVVFCAPLLRPDWYPALIVGERLFGRWLHTMPSSFGWDGYLDGYTMPVHWFRALDQWLEDRKSTRLNSSHRL